MKIKETQKRCLVECFTMPFLALHLSSCATAVDFAYQRGPRVAHHQHLISPSFGALVKHDPLNARALLEMMDAAGSERAVVLSMAYSFADERKGLMNPDLLVRQENDWTSSQVAVAPHRLRGFCGVNPLTPDALQEIERCNRLPGMAGLKLHFGNSGVSLRKAEHVARMRDIFALADRLRVPIAVHLRSRTSTPYGAEDARLFIDKLLPVAPHVTVQIAHLAGAGPGHTADADASLEVFVQALKTGDARMKKVIFDATTVASPDGSPEDGALIASRLRQIGLKRIVFGSDMTIGANPPIAQSWQIFLAKVPLNAAEFRQIAQNVAPYLKP